MNDKVKFVHMLHGHSLIYNFRGLRYDVCLKGGSIHDDQATLVMLYDHFLELRLKVCVVSLFDRGFIHDDKAKLVKFLSK